MTLSVGGKVALRSSSASTTAFAKRLNATPDTVFCITTGTPSSPLLQMPATSGICPRRRTLSFSASSLPPSFPKM